MMRWLEWWRERRELRARPKATNTVALRIYTKPQPPDTVTVIGRERLAELGKQALQNISTNGLISDVLNTARLYEEDRLRLRRVLGSDMAYDLVCVWMSLRYAKGYPLARATTIAVELTSAGLTPQQMTVDGAIAKVVDQHELLYGAYCTNSRETIVTTARDWASRYVRMKAAPYDWNRDGL